MPKIEGSLQGKKVVSCSAIVDAHSSGASVVLVDTWCSISETALVAVERSKMEANLSGLYLDVQ